MSERLRLPRRAKPTSRGPVRRREGARRCASSLRPFGRFRHIGPANAASGGQRQYPERSKRGSSSEHLLNGLRHAWRGVVPHVTDLHRASVPDTRVRRCSIEHTSSPAADGVPFSTPALRSSVHKRTDVRAGGCENGHVKRRRRTCGEAVMRRTSARRRPIDDLEDTYDTRTR